METSAYGSMQKRNRAGRRDLAPAAKFYQILRGASRLPLRFVRNRLFSAKFSLARADMEVRPYGLCVVVCSLQKAALAF